MILRSALLRISDCPEKVIDLAITECHRCTDLYAMPIILENQDIVAISPQMRAYAEEISHTRATSTLLVCPGYRSRMADFLGIGAHLWRDGYNVLVFEYYGHGIEVSTPVTLGYREINDFLGAVAYAKERAPQNHLGALSYSMGAAVAIMSSARNTDVEALVVDSSFATHRGVVKYNFHRTFHLPSAPFAWIADYMLWWRAGYRFHQVEPLRDIALHSR